MEPSSSEVEPVPAVDIAAPPTRGRRRCQGRGRGVSARRGSGGGSIRASGRGSKAVKLAERNKQKETEALQIRDRELCVK